FRTSAAKGKFRQQGMFGGLRITPVFGSSGPGAQIPIPLTEDGPSGSKCAIAEKAACNPRSGESFENIATRFWERISPFEVTTPAATLVPPISTPTNKFLSTLRSLLLRDRSARD